MPENLGDFLKLYEAPQHYKVTAKTLRRRREAAHSADDDDTLSNYLLVTKDGEQKPRPSSEAIAQLKKNGISFRWYVNKNWLNQHFAGRPTEQKDVVQSPTDDQQIVSPKASPDDQHKTLDNAGEQLRKFAKSDVAIAALVSQVDHLKEQLVDAKKETAAVRDDVDARVKQAREEAEHYVTLLLPPRRKSIWAKLTGKGE